MHTVLKRSVWIALTAMGWFLASCNGLGEPRATQLIRLKYRQQNTTSGGGQWLLDSIQVVSIQKVATDTFEVNAVTNGLYQLSLESSPTLYPSAAFRDTIRFIAWKTGKVWVARNWVITGSNRR